MKGRYEPYDPWYANAIVMYHVLKKCQLSKDMCSFISHMVYHQEPSLEFITYEQGNLVQIYSTYACKGCKRIYITGWKRMYCGVQTHSLFCSVCKCGFHSDKENYHH